MYFQRTASEHIELATKAVETYESQLAAILSSQVRETHATKISKNLSIPEKNELEQNVVRIMSNCNTDSEMLVCLLSNMSAVISDESIWTAAEGGHARNPSNTHRTVLHALQKLSPDKLPISVQYDAKKSYTVECLRGWILKLTS